MKTPEEIKKGLKCCGDYKTESCDGCPYEVKECAENQALCLTYLALDALDYIRQLEETIGSLGHLNKTMHDEAKKGIQTLESRLTQAERERDAALQALHDVCSFCKGHCLEISGGYLPDCEHCMIKNYRPENTKEDGNGA